MRVSTDIAGGGHEEDRHHRSHARCQSRVDARGSLDSLDIEQRENRAKKDCPSPVRHARGEDVRLLGAPDDADHRIQHVIHHHAPSGHVAESRIDLLPHVRERRTGAWVRARHASIAKGGEQHGHHGNQQRGNNMSAAALTEHAEDRHGRGGLDYDNAVKDQVPQR